MTQAMFSVPSTAVYVDTVTGSRRHFKAGDVIPLELAVRYAMPGASLPAGAAPFTDPQLAYLQDGFEPEGNFATLDHEHTPETEARTATADGLTTGTVSDPASGSVFVTVTSGNANHIAKLPTNVAFTTVVLEVGPTGYELRSHNPAAVGINDGRGANAESAVPPDTVTVCLGSADGLNWRCTDQAADGQVVTTEAAA